MRKITVDFRTFKQWLRSRIINELGAPDYGTFERVSRFCEEVFDEFEQDKLWENKAPKYNKQQEEAKFKKAQQETERLRKIEADYYKKLKQIKLLKNVFGISLLVIGGLVTFLII